MAAEDKTRGGSFYLAARATFGCHAFADLLQTDETVPRDRESMVPGESLKREGSDGFATNSHKAAE